jgi:hypothetical protein
MMTFPTIERAGDDAPGFVDSVDRVVAGLAFRYRPHLVGIVRIRRWFDHRWLRFSGKGRVFFDSPFLADPAVSLDEFRQDQLTFPPFVPTRVAAEHHWERTTSGSYARMLRRFQIHRPQRQHSESNLQRRIADLTDSALFIWLSSASTTHRHGSVLVYIVNAGTTVPWFASMRTGSSGWRLGSVKGLGRAEVQELLDHPPGVRSLDG